MKLTNITSALLIALLFTACQEGNKKGDDHGDHGDKQCVNTYKYHKGPEGDVDTNYIFMPVDSCNKMIASYLQSINYQQNDTDLCSLIFNADSMRSYLSNPKVVKVKLMFAHTLNYVNQGGQGKYAGYQSGALTMVIAGYDAQGNYVFYYFPQSQQAMAMDHLIPCPTCCPRQGTAASNLLPTTNGDRK